MTEDEARRILYKHFSKLLGKDQAIWIGESINPDETGYNFRAGIYDQNEELPAIFPVWGVDAKTKSVGLDLTPNV